MANPIAEAFVRLRPDASALRADTQSAIAQALGRVTIPVGVGRNLGQLAFGGPGFAAAAQTSTSTALSNAVVPPDTQRRLAQQLFGPGFRNETGRALQGALAGIGQGQLAAQFAFFGPGGAALAVLGTALGIATREAALLEQQLDILAAVTDASENEIAQMGETAERLGASIRLPAVTATDAANAMLELSKAGLSVRDVIGGVEGVLQLATAANIDAGSAARIAASALNAFSLEGREAVTVADLLASASVAAQGDIGDMALALQQSAAVADQAGLSVQQLVTYITLLAKQGILGSDAGTSIRTSLLRLVPTTEEAAGFMRALGIEIDRTRTLGQQFPELIDQYQVALSGLNPTLRQSTLQQIFGTDAIRAATVAINGGSDAFRTAQFEVSRHGTALKLAEASTQGLIGESKGLVSGLQTLATNVGQLTNPFLSGLVSGFSDATAAANQFADAIEQVADFELPTGGTFGGFFTEAFRVLNPVTRTLDGMRDAVKALAEGDIPALGRALAETLTLPGSVGVAAFEALTDEQQKSAASMLETLATAEDLRIELSKAGLPTADITAQIKTLKAQLADLADAGDVNIELDTPIERAIAKAEELKQALLDQGLPVAKIQAQIDLLRNDLEIGLIRASQQAEREANARAQLGRALGLSSAQLSRLMATVKQDGKAAGVELGKSMIDGLTGTITAEEGRAIAAAQATLERVRREGEKQVIESIRSARANLEALGDSLTANIGEIIDVGPIGQAIDEIDRKLDELQEKVTRRQLRFDTRQAQQDLRDAQQSIIQVGVLTPAQKRAQQEFLEPFRQKVQDAKAAAKEFTLEEQRVELIKTRDQAVNTAEQGIQRLIDKFQNGQVSVDEFQQLLSQKLNPELQILKSRAGTNLGLSIKRDFLRDVEALRAQAEALAGFLGRTGTTPGPQIVRPADTQAQVNAQIAAALSALQQTQADALVVEKDERDKIDIQVGLLRKLVQLAGGTSKTRTGGKAPGFSIPKGTD